MKTVASASERSQQWERDEHERRSDPHYEVAK
jgi:hypothetical protein